MFFKNLNDHNCYESIIIYKDHYRIDAKLQS